MHSILSGHIECKEVPGLVSLVSHNGEVHIEVLGDHSMGDSKAMQRDSIFRVASLTKPVTAAAAMVLVEDCKLRLDDSIEAWLPELANRRVLRSIESQLDDTVPAQRAITVRDLLTSTMGFGSVMAAPDTYPIQRYIREYRLGGDGPQLPSQAPTLDEWLRALGSLPLMAQPGERWLYNTSIDALGALIARASGQSLGTFMRERIFAPLGMKDTGFHVPAEKLTRLPDFYYFDRASNELKHFDDPAHSAWAQEPPSESGSGGLVSTIDDYYAFCNMLLQKGRHGKEQILSRASVDLMTSDQVTAKQREGSDIFFGSHSSWGFGGSVDTARHEVYHYPGRFGWTGGFGTAAYTDPAQKVIGILFTQRMMDSPVMPKIYSDFWTLAYMSLE